MTPATPRLLTATAQLPTATHAFPAARVWRGWSRVLGAGRLAHPGDALGGCVGLRMARNDNLNRRA